MEPAILAALIASVTGVLASLLPLAWKVIRSRREIDDLKHAELQRIATEIEHLTTETELKRQELRRVELEQRLEELQSAIRNLRDAGAQIELRLPTGATRSTSLPSATESGQ